LFGKYCCYIIPFITAGLHGLFLTCHFTTFGQVLCVVLYPCAPPNIVTPFHTCAPHTVLEVGVEYGVISDAVFVVLHKDKL